MSGIRKKGIIELLGKDGLEEIAGPGTKEPTERHVMKLEIEIVELKTEFAEINQRVQEIDEDYKKKREDLIEQADKINAQISKIDNKLFSLLKPKVQDVKQRKIQEESEEGVEVG
jgi:glutaredoxin 2